VYFTHEYLVLLFFRQAAEALPKLVDFSEIDFTTECAIPNRNGLDQPIESEEHENNTTFQPFSGCSNGANDCAEIDQQTANFQTNHRISNFDAQMLRMHAFGAKKSRKSSTLFNRKSQVHDDEDEDVEENEDIAKWRSEGRGSVASKHALRQRQRESAVNTDKEGAEEWENNEDAYDTTITGMGTSGGGGGGGSNDEEEGTGINFTTTLDGASSSSGQGSFSKRFHCLSKKEFSFGISILEKHQKWVQRAARRYDPTYLPTYLPTWLYPVQFFVMAPSTSLSAFSLSFSLKLHI
jgi:hypothetical protein